MGRRKIVLAGGYVRDLLFPSEDHAQAHIQSLEYRGLEYKILDSLRRDDGSMILRIVQQYNNSPLINLDDE